MKKPKIPKDEAFRLEQLRRYEVLDTPAEIDFDQITEVASIVCECKISLISLVDHDRQWFKSAYGLDAIQTPRDVSFCGHAIHSDEIFEVENSELNKDFCDNPLFLGEPNVRFYAGAPLITSSGHRIGTLCVIDDKQKKLTTNQRKVLKNLAAQVIALLESRCQKADIQITQKVNATASQVKSEYIKYQKDPHRFFDYILSKILELTESEYGFIGEIKVDPSTNQKYLKTFALTNISWSQETKKFYEENAPTGLEFKNLDSLFGEVIRSEKPIITNDPLNHPSSAGIPDGHPNLDAFMGIPIFQAGKFIGMAGLANKRSGYSQKLYDEIQFLIESIGEVIYAHQIQRSLTQSELFNTFYKIALDKAAIVAFTDKDGKITYANELFCEISKYSREELIGQDHRILNSSFHNKDFFSNLWKTISGGETWKGEICNKAKDGSVYWVDTVIVPYKNERGDIDKYIAIRKDITQEKLKQQLLDLAVTESRAATEAKSDFLSTMSHEIRTPLNGIIGILSLMNETKLDGEQSEYISSIEQSSSSLLMLINDIFDFSKIEAGKMELEETFFNLDDFVGDVIRPFHFSAEKKGIKFEQRFKNSSLSVLGDSSRIGQIINNLISNAIKFTKDGKVSIALDTKVENQVCLIEIRVSDTGIGIPEQSKSRMFQAFSQADSSVNRKFGGTGLGLSISHKLVTLMNGNITFESEEEKGTTFIVKIPLKQWKEKTAAQIDVDVDVDANISIERLNILVAEDNPTNQILMKNMLSNIGCRFQIVSNGNEVIDSVRDFKFDLILMDCQMPEMDGFQATKLIRRSNSLPDEIVNIPIIALTANAIKGDEQACYKAGMNDYLAKPITLNILKQKLRFFLKNNKVNIKCTSIVEQNAFSSNELEKLSTSIGYAALKELIESYLATSKKNLEEISNGLNQNKGDIASRSAHSLKSTSELLGARVLTGLLQKLEIEASDRNSDFNKNTFLFNQIQDELLKFQSYLKNYIAEDKSSCFSDEAYISQHKIKLKIALVDDDPNIHILIDAYLKEHKYIETVHFYNTKDFVEKINGVNYDFIILDNQIGNESGFEMLKDIIIKKSHNFSVVLLSSCDKSEIPFEMKNRKEVTFAQKPIIKTELLKLLKLKQ